MRTLAWSLVCLVMLGASALGHHAVEPRMRVVVVSEHDGDTILHLRLPAPLLFAHELTLRSSVGARVETPFLEAVQHDQGWVHYLDSDAIAEAQDEFGTRILSTFRIILNGRPATPVVTRFALHSTGGLPPLGTLEEAEAALNQLHAQEHHFVGETVVDAELRVVGGGELTLGSTVDDLVLPPDIYFENTILDLRGPTEHRIVRLGPWHEPVRLDPP